MPIFDVIDAGDVTELRRLLAENPDAANARDEKGLSPVMHAAYGGRIDIAALLRPLDGWDRLVLGDADDLPAPGEWSPDGFTPLPIAAFAHDHEAARRLLEHGADPSIAEVEGGTPLDVARANGNDELVELLGG
ncbi:MAG TPA: ankyrin repeat domain-containing protein [Gaiellaceae bacterium]|nr:ankyrin repeat domain-containing protein [Gaiellaceae bacterium]